MSFVLQNRIPVIYGFSVAGSKQIQHLKDKKLAEELVVDIGSATPARIPRVVYALTACVGVIGSNSLVLGPIAPEVARSLGTAAPSVMMASAAFGLGTAASALFLARHIDRFGAYRVLKCSMGLLAVALLLSAMAPAVVALVAAQLIVGTAAGVALPAIYASAASEALPGHESRTIGIVLTGWTLSMVAGVSLSVVLAELLHWRAVYAAIATLALLALFALRHLGGHDRRAAVSAPTPLSALGLTGIKQLLVVCAAFMTAFYGLYGYLGDYFHRGLGLPIMANSSIALVYGAGFGGAALLNGVVDRMGARRLMPVALISIAGIYLVLAVAGDSMGVVLTLLFLLGLANHFVVNLLILRLTSIDPAQRGTIMGLNSAVTYLGVFGGTSSFGPIYAHHGFSAAACAAMVLTLVAAGVSSWR